MAQNHPTFLAIDLKSFYASVECIERKLDPITTNLVVADKSRTEKTICLAVSPSLKAYGIPGRARLFEVVQKVREVNARRLLSAPGGAFLGSSCQDPELKSSPGLSLDYIVAPPRMAHYMEYSARIYQIYLKYVAPEDIHVYSIDEVFIDATHYLSAYGLTPREFAAKIMHDVLRTTGITATAGIGTNLYLCKVAMDIVAKHVEPDKKRRAHRKAGRVYVSADSLDASAADRFLAHREGICAQIGPKRPIHNGRHRPLLTRCAYRLLQ